MVGLKMYVQNIPIRGIFEKDIELSIKNKLSNLTHVMIMAAPVAISVETPKIDSGCFLEKEFTELIRMNP